MDQIDLEIRNLKWLKEEKEGKIWTEKVHIFCHKWKTEKEVNLGIANLLKDKNWCFNQNVLEILMETKTNHLRIKVLDIKDKKRMQYKLGMRETSIDGFQLFPQSFLKSHCYKSR